MRVAPHRLAAWLAAFTLIARTPLTENSNPRTPGITGNSNTQLVDDEKHAHSGTRADSESARSLNVSQERSGERVVELVMDSGPGSPPGITDPTPFPTETRPPTRPAPQKIMQHFPRDPAHDSPVVSLQALEATTQGSFHHGMGFIIL